MSLKCELTPKELFFCTRVMKGKYLDYDYFRKTPDVQKQYLLHEQETLDQLDEKGIIELDFDGNAVVDPDYEELLKPVFFGEKESRLDVENKPSRRFHIYEGKIVMSLIGEERISFCEITEEELASFLKEEKVEIYLSDVRRGRKNGVFTSQDLKIRANRELAMKLMKGEL
ncbi:MAG: hypothetical protein ACI4TF_07710 [Oliverpabstia sp.]